MSWVTLIWTVVPTVCVTLAVMHLLLWSQNRAARASMAFGITALGVAASAACELWMMRAASTGEYGRALRWMHVPAWVVIIALVAFVRLHLRAGRPWLAWSVFGLRSLALLLNFIFVPNLNFREITSLRHIPFLGEPVAVALGMHNPWMLVGQAAFLLLAIFVVDAFWTMLRRHDRRTAVVLAGTIVFFVLTGTLQVVLVLWGVVETPLTTGLFFFVIMLAMAYEMSSDLRRAAQLSDDLRESEDRMRLAAEAAGFGVWVWNVASNVIWGSDRWLRLFEFSPDAPVSLERLLDRVHPDDRMLVARNVRHALVVKQDYAAEYRAVLPDGRLRWVSARGRVYADAAGKPVRMVGATLDVTERKRAEHKLVEQRSELVHMARVSAVGQLAGSLAHELNQPLGAIMRNAEAGELFLNEPSPDLDEVRAILADIRKDDQRAGAVIDRMRSLMRRREVRHHSLDVSQMAGEVVALAQADAGIRRVRLGLEAAPDLPPIRGDRVQLQQVMLNLVLNGMDALKGLPPANHSVVVQIRRAGPAVEVTVRDNGPGIPADALRRVFEPFFTTKPEGLGMGLAISRGIIEAHGGRIGAENDPAGGAVLTFTLPVAEEDAPQ